MFKDWQEYRDHLHENLTPAGEPYDKFKRHFKRCDAKYEINPLLMELFCKTCVSAVLRNDYYSTSIKNFENITAVGTYFKWRQGNTVFSPHIFFNKNKYYLYDRKMGMVTSDGMETTVKVGSKKVKKQTENNK